MSLLCCRNSSHVAVGAVSNAYGKPCSPLPTCFVYLVRAVSPLMQPGFGGSSKAGKKCCSVMAAIVAALLCRDLGSGSAPPGFCPPRFQQRQAAATCAGNLYNFTYCLSVDFKDHEFDLPVTLLPSAAELLFGLFRDPGSWQLSSDWTLRCSSFCGFLEFEPVGSFSSSPGNGKRDSAKDESLLLVIFVKLFAYPQVEMAAVRQLRSCITAGSSAAAQAVGAAAALDVYCPLSFDCNNAFEEVFPVLFDGLSTGFFWVSLVAFGVTALCFVLGTLEGDRCAGEGVAHCVALVLCARFLRDPMVVCGHVLGLRVGGAPCGASLALRGRPCWLPRDMASMMSGVGELYEAKKRPHYASQAEATPRVDVGEVSQASGDNAARSCKDRNPCTKGRSNKRFCH